MRYFLIIPILSFLFSCKSNTGAKVITVVKNKTTNTVNEVRNNDSDTGLVSEPCAVIISPTDKQIDKMKGEDSAGFYAVADDNDYYSGTAISFLDSAKTKTIFREAKGNIKFKLPDGKITAVALDTFYWGILLFNGRTEPIKANMSLLTPDFKKYMSANK